jgi:hypothetical protein
MNRPIPPTNGALWASALAALREDGWSLAVHNDYVLDGRLRTFWLFTRRGGTSLKGEGGDDARALGEALAGCGLTLPKAAPTEGEAILDGLRSAGWQVAIHNDFRIEGRPRTFWRMVHPETGRYVDGEGDDDGKALAACRAAAAWSVTA